MCVCVCVRYTRQQVALNFYIKLMILVTEIDQVKYKKVWLSVKAKRRLQISRIREPRRRRPPVAVGATFFGPETVPN